MDGKKSGYTSGRGQIQIWKVSLLYDTPFHSEQIISHPLHLIWKTLAGKTTRLLLFGNDLIHSLRLPKKQKRRLANWHCQSC